MGVERVGAHQNPRVEQILRVEERLHRAEQPDRLRRVEGAEQFPAGPAVAVLAGQRPAVPGDEGGRLPQETAQHRAAVGPVEREVQPQVQAAVTEVAVGHPVQVVFRQQGVEVAQVGTQPLRGHRGVLPPRVGPPAPCGHAHDAGPVLPDAPQRRRVGRLGDQEAVDGARTGDHPPPGGERLPLGGPRDLDEQPAAAAGQRGDPPGSPAGTHQVGDTRIEPLAGHRVLFEHPRGGVGRVVHVGIAEDDEHPVGGLRHQPHGRADARDLEHFRQIADEPVRHIHPGGGDAGDRHPDDNGEGALAAHQQPAHVHPTLRKQVLQRVAGHLAAEPAEFGAHRRQVRGHQVREPGHGLAVAAVESKRAPVSREHVQAHHVVRGAPIAQRSGPAGVVADHPPDGAAGVRGRVRTETQPGGRRRALECRVHQPGLHCGGACLRIEGQHRVHVPAEVHHDSRTDRVARDRGPAAPAGEGQATLPAHRQGCGHLCGVAGAHHGSAHQPVERGVRGVRRAGQRRGAHVGHAGSPQCVLEVGGLPGRARRHGALLRQLRRSRIDQLSPIRHVTCYTSVGGGSNLTLCPGARPHPRWRLWTPRAAPSPTRQRRPSAGRSATATCGRVSSTRHTTWPTAWGCHAAPSGRR